jgi:hypothetical protein
LIGLNANFCTIARNTATLAKPKIGLESKVERTVAKTTNIFLLIDSLLNSWQELNCLEKGQK